MKRLMAGLILFSGLLGGVSAPAAVLERGSWRDVASLVDQGTLVVFDIDNTLVQPAQSLGSDQWFTYVMKSYVERGMPKEDALAKTLAFWRRINEVTRVVPAEPETPLFMRRLQDRGIRVMALTSRSTDVVDLTERHLREAGYDLTRTAARGTGDVVLAPGLRYRRGVLFRRARTRARACLSFSAISAKRRPGLFSWTISNATSSRWRWR